VWGFTGDSYPIRDAVPGGAEEDEMAGSSYQTDIQTMGAASQKVQNVNQQIQSRLSQLRSQLEPLAGVWKGEAFSSFQSLMSRWDQDAAQLNQALHGIGDGLRGNQQRYQHSEESNQTSFRSISNRLG
jgi:WXG100 family type VII secretion target